MKGIHIAKLPNCQIAMPINVKSIHLVEAAVVDIASMLSKLKQIVGTGLTGFHSIQLLTV